MLQSFRDLERLVCETSARFHPPFQEVLMRAALTKRVLTGCDSFESEGCSDEKGRDLIFRNCTISVKPRQKKKRGSEIVD